MHYQLYEIDPRLKPFVSLMGSMARQEVVGSPSSIRVLPDACVELFVSVGAPQQVIPAERVSVSAGRSFITSRMNRFMDVQTQGAISFVSVCFVAGQAHRFFPVSMHEVANQVVDVRALWGCCADDLQEQVESAGTTAQRVQIIQRNLIQRLQKSEAPDPAILFCADQINQTNGQLSLQELAKQAGMSNRHLIRRFNQCIGLAPKEFARIIAFKNALKCLKKHPSLSLTEIACEIGYYDQAHFIRACRDFAGLTPSQLRPSPAVLY